MCSLPWLFCDHLHSGCRWVPLWIGELMDWLRLGKPNEPHDESASHDLGPQSQRAPRFRRPRQKRMMRKGGPNGRASPMRLGPGRWRPPIRLGSVHRPWASVGASVWVLRGPRGPPLSLLRRVCQSPPFVCRMLGDRLMICPGLFVYDRDHHQWLVWPRQRRTPSLRRRR